MFKILQFHFQQTFCACKDFLMIVLFCLFLCLNSDISIQKWNLLCKYNAEQNTLNDYKYYKSSYKIYFCRNFIFPLTGIIVYIGCIVVKVNFPILWGFIAFVMNFIPTIGSIISCFVTILLHFTVLAFSCSCRAYFHYYDWSKYTFGQHRRTQNSGENLIKSVYNYCCIIHMGLDLGICRHGYCCSYYGCNQNHLRKY